ncbi:MAG: glycosyltransferase family 2 protein [Myxococcota bacterium]|nr:glycosyltransferase family 2 protein [Myxococcota bacterium]
MPCLDEAETLAGCIQAARECIQGNDLDAEIIVADNGSRDGSQEIAEREGARLVPVSERGYGSALRGGFAAARGRYVLMGDADLSYDFGQAHLFVERLREGADLVMGSRFRGRIEPGAMPWHHRWIGNPVLSFVGRLFFRTRVSDFHCGLRAMRREAYESLGLRTTGMEFASEMVVKASVRGLRIEEVPITLRPDGRSRPPHLRSWRDGWRHLRFLMLLSPRWTLLLPGLAALFLGLLLGAIVAIGPFVVGGITLDVHTLVASSLLVLIGFQGVTTSVAVRLYGVEEEVGPPAPWIDRVSRAITLERGLILGFALTLSGFGLVGYTLWSWAQEGFGPLDVTVTLRPMVIGATLVAVGVQALLMSFVYSMLGLKREAGHGSPASR